MTPFLVYADLCFWDQDFSDPSSRELFHIKPGKWRKWQKSSIEKFQNQSILGQLADPLFFTTARNLGPQILMIVKFFKKLTPF